MSQGLGQQWHRAGGMTLATGDVAVLPMRSSMTARVGGVIDRARLRCGLE